MKRTQVTFVIQLKWWKTALVVQLKQGMWFNWSQKMCIMYSICNRDIVWERKRHNCNLTREWGGTDFSVNHLNCMHVIQLGKKKHIWNSVEMKRPAHIHMEEKYMCLVHYERNSIYVILLKEIIRKSIRGMSIGKQTEILKKNDGGGGISRRRARIRFRDKRTSSWYFTCSKISQSGRVGIINAMSVPYRNDEIDISFRLILCSSVVTHWANI